MRPAIDQPGYTFIEVFGYEHAAKVEAFLRRLTEAVEVVLPEDVPVKPTDVEAWTAKLTEQRGMKEIQFGFVASRIGYTLVLSPPKLRTSLFAVHYSPIEALWVMLMEGALADYTGAAAYEELRVAMLALHRARTVEEILGKIPERVTTPDEDIPF